MTSIDMIIQEQVRHLTVTPPDRRQRTVFERSSLTEIKEISQAEIAWLAGLLEGEGCFSSVTSQNHYPKITLRMTNHDIIERVADMWEVRVWLGDQTKPYVERKKDGTPRKTQWVATIGGVRAAKWMRVVYPWMGERRRAKIDEVIELSPQAAKYGVA